MLITFCTGVTCVLISQGVGRQAISRHSVRDLRAYISYWMHFTFHHSENSEHLTPELIIHKSNNGSYTFWPASFLDCVLMSRVSLTFHASGKKYHGRTGLTGAWTLVMARMAQSLKPHLLRSCNVAPPKYVYILYNIVYIYIYNFLDTFFYTFLGHSCGSCGMGTSSKPCNTALRRLVWPVHRAVHRWPLVAVRKPTRRCWSQQRMKLRLNQQRRIREWNDLDNPRYQLYVYNSSTYILYSNNTMLEIWFLILSDRIP